MDTPATRVLLVMDDTSSASRVRAALAAVRDRRLDVVSAARLEDTLGLLAAAELDVALVDCSLPDGPGRATFRAVQEQVPGLPVIVLHAPGADAAGQQAVTEGAADHLSTGSLDPELVSRAIRYAVERQQLLGDLRRLALVDGATGIANRRGFVAMSEGLVRLAERTGLTVTVLYADVDGLEEINEAFGHAEGDRALRAVAKLLRATFRASDVVARVGGDEFCVLLLHDGVGESPAVRRLDEAVAAARTPGGRYALSLSLGVAHCTPGRPASVEELVERAAGAMRDGRARRSRAAGPAGPRLVAPVATWGERW